MSYSSSFGKLPFSQSTWYDITEQDVNQFINTLYINKYSEIKNFHDIMNQFVMFLRNLLIEHISDKNLLHAIHYIDQRIQPKQKDRILDKISEEKTHDVPNYFRTINDIFACRIIISPIYFAEIMNVLKTRFNDKKVFTDIVQFIYIQHEDHIFELQLLHPFAHLTFEQDTFNRSVKNAGLKPSYDLWDKSFYIKVREYILNSLNTHTEATDDDIKNTSNLLHEVLINCYPNVLIYEKIMKSIYPDFKKNSDE